VGQNLPKNNLMRKELNLAKNIVFSNFNSSFFPYKLTLAVTYKCNSKCHLCHIWEKDSEKEIGLGEIKKFFQKNNRFNWIDLTGGEPFLRMDLVNICKIIIKNCPNLYLLHIPTNGLLPQKIEKNIKDILKFKPHNFIISVALDGPPLLHDKLRGIKGNYPRAVETYKRLKKIKEKNFEVFFGMTLSGYNYNFIEKTYQSLRKEIKNLERNDLHFNIAHHSFYYRNLKINLGLNKKITLNLRSFIEKREKKFSGVQFLESKYQSLIPKYLKTGRSPLSCQALKASLFIDPYGDVYPCTLWNKKITNLKDINYDLKNIWLSDKVKNLRKQIVNDKCCGCWTPCEAYQTILGNLSKAF